ncbi:hypothetical protein jhhlp_005434 [Lomentospora prolificans]|uniref:Erythromycin esterase n=1 Tax=Lomentospora prolificans TaxID=41688 RepID=A0A2N3N6V2_9PEZI|nr:hypothetical protein jhhlp_005434 [Lomentospora prolificans]
MPQSVPAMIREAAVPLPAIEDAAFGAMFDRFGQSQVVLLGDSTHGTSEFYRAHSAIIQRLITHHGFKTVAIEADWPDARKVDRYVRQDPSRNPDQCACAFKHFPKWMWRNDEFRDFIHWLRRHNASLPPERRTRIAGLDLYSMGASIRAVQDYLKRTDKYVARLAKKRYGCLEPWIDDPARYGKQAFLDGTAPCEKGVIKMLRDLMSKRLDLERQEDGEKFFDAEMNARLIHDAEKYYRSMYYGAEDAWNLRDTHFFNTLTRLLQTRPGKAVVWAHTSHVGDARYTSAGHNRGVLNIGQLCKQHFGASCSIIGCSTHTGTVAAARGWDDDMEVIHITPSDAESYERLMHNTDIPSFMLDLRKGHLNESLRNELMEKRLERYIGVVYRQSTEKRSHYIRAALPMQMDCLVWFDETRAVSAFEKAQPEEAPSVGETYPFGL